MRRRECVLVLALAWPDAVRLGAQEVSGQEAPRPPAAAGLREDAVGADRALGAGVAQPEAAGTTGAAPASVAGAVMAPGGTNGSPGEVAVAEDFPLEAGAGDINFRTFDVPADAGLAATVATMEKTFFDGKAPPSLTVRLGSENTLFQRVVSFKMSDGPLKPLTATTFAVKDGSFQGKRDSLRIAIPMGRVFDVTMAWRQKRLEIRVDGVPKYRGEIDFVPVFYHVQVQSGRVAFRSVAFGPARFVEGAPSRSKRVNR